MQRPVYSTLSLLTRELSQLNTVQQGDTADLIDANVGLQLLDTVSRRVDEILGNNHVSWFGPVIETRRQRVTSLNSSNAQGWLALNTPLVSLTTALYGTDDTNLATDLSVDEPQLLTLSDATCWYDLTMCQARNARLALTGLWGLADYPEDPWDATTVLTDPLNAESTALPVVSDAVFGIAAYGVTDPGRVLKVDDELMLVVKSVADAPTVLRGQLGSAAAEHDADAVVYAWTYPASLSHEVARQAAMLYERRGAFQAQAVDGLGIVTYPQDILTSLYAVLTEFQR